jgi:hypothetical protein
MEWMTGDRLIGELVALAGPAYVFLQILMAMRYRGRWRLAALAPLLVMMPLAVHAGLAYAAGAPGWPVLLVLAAPVAFASLLLVGIARSSAGSLAARRAYLGDRSKDIGRRQ